MGRLQKGEDEEVGLFRQFNKCFDGVGAVITGNNGFRKLVVEATFSPQKRKGKLNLLGVSKRRFQKQAKGEFATSRLEDQIF